MTKEQIGFILDLSEYADYFSTEDLANHFPDVDWQAEKDARNEARLLEWVSRPHTDTGGAKLSEVSALMREIWEPAVAELVYSASPLTDFLKEKK